MTREDMLARLLAQATSEGSELVTLRAIVEEASELGTERVLARMGLSDPKAQGDLNDLRELVQAWRDAKASAWRAAVTWFVRGLLALLLVGLAMRLGYTDLLKS